jgi:hypothetical protein
MRSLPRIHAEWVGAGLAICRMMIGRHGGQLTASSSGKSGAHSANQNGGRVFDSVALRLLRRGPSLTADWVNRMGAPKSYVSTSVVFGVCALCRHWMQCKH